VIVLAENMLYLSRTNSTVVTKVVAAMQPDKRGGTEQVGPVLISEIREWRCSGKDHHRVGMECLVRWNGQRYRMLHEDGTPEGSFKEGVRKAFCVCGARWEYHSGGRIPTEPFE
jgi:hypothetical protein